MNVSMLLSLRDVLLLVQFINRQDLHCRLRKQVGYLYFTFLRFPSLRPVTCVFHTYIFHPCKFILMFPVLAFSILRNRTISYFPFPYLRFPGLALSDPTPTVKARLEIMHSFVRSFVSLIMGRFM